MVTATAPVLAKADRADQNPARVYLARLAPGSRRAQAGALEAIARLLSADQVGAEALPWAELRYQHTQAARTALAGRYAPATANRMLAALRGVLREAWRLGQLGAEELARATDLATVHGFRLPAGREVTPGELSTLFSLSPGISRQGQPARQRVTNHRRDGRLRRVRFRCERRRRRRFHRHAQLRRVPRLTSVSSLWMSHTQHPILQSFTR